MSIEPIASSENSAEEISAFLDARNRRLKTVASTTLPRGQIIDWAASIERDASAVPPTAPPLPILNLTPDQQTSLVQFEQASGIMATGPKGTLPWLRPGRLLTKGMKLADFLSKYRRAGVLHVRLDNGMHIAVPSPSATDHHRYASTGQSVNSYGAEGIISVWHPYAESPGDFSLMQIGITRGQNDSMQSVEAGWHVFPDLYDGDETPHFFTFYTTNGYSSNGDNLGGYNSAQAGWVQVDTSVCPGTALASFSIPGGSQSSMAVKYQLRQGNWWLAVNGRWIGYYPASLFARNGSVSGTLGEISDFVGFWGEVYDSEDATGKGVTRTTMGSGLWAEDCYPWAAFQNSLKVQTDQAGTLVDYDCSPPYVSNPNMYNIIINMNSGTSSGSYFYMGGPGAN